MSVYTLRNLRQQATAEHDRVQAERDAPAAPTPPTSPVTSSAAAPTDPSRSLRIGGDNAESPISGVAPLPSSPAAALRASALSFARSDATILCYFFLVLLLYFGGCANPLQWLSRLHILVIDLDSPPPSTPALRLTMGQTLQAAINGLTGDHLSFYTHSASDYPSTAAAIDAAYAAPAGSDYWAAILVSANATAQWQADVQTALSGGVVVTAPTQGGVQLLVETARNSFLYGNYILGQLSPLLGQCTGVFEVAAGQRLLTLISACPNATQCVAAFLAQPPMVQAYLLSPMAWSEVDVAPAQPFIGTVATTLGLVIQWIFCAAVIGTTIGNSTRLMLTMSVWKVVALRVANTLGMTLALSGLFVGMVAWWAEGAYDGRTMGVYWMFAWLYMSTFCGFNIFFALNLGVFADLTGVLFLFLNVVSSTSQLPVQLQQRFYTIGVGLPLYNAIVGSRRILMNGRQEDIGVNVGVLLAWLFGSSVLNSVIDARRMHSIKQRQQLARQSPLASPSP